jgi:peptidyl-prolyl cis-trans isomerase B (cyclophilin B)
MSRKNPFKGAIVLTLVAAVAVGLYFVLKPIFEKNESSVDSATLLFAGLGREEVYEIQIRNPSTGLLVKKLADKTDTWSVAGSPPMDPTAMSPSFDADPGSVNGIISTILAARKEQSLPNVKAPDVGLSPAMYEVSVHFGSNQKRTLLLGHDTPVDYLVYAQWSDKPEIFLTSRSLRFGIDKKVSELRDKRLFNLKLSDLKEIGIKPGANAGYKVLKDMNFVKNEKGEWSAETAKPVALKTEELANFIETLNKSTVKEFASEKSEEREKFGFKKPILELTLVPAGDGAKPQLWKLSQTVETLDGVKKTRYFLADANGEATYEVNSTFRDTFEVDLMKFRETQVTDIALADVTQIVVHDLKGTIVTLTKQGDAWKSEAGDPKTLAPAKTEKVNQILASLAQLHALQFYDDGNLRKVGLDKPIRVVEISTAKGTQTLFFGKTAEAGVYAVNTEGLSAPASVRVDVEAVMPTDPNAYRTTSAVPATASASEAKKGKKVKLEPTVSSPKDIRKLPAPIVKPGHRYTAIMKLSNGKELEIEFAADKAPYTVSNFLHLARNHFYDGVVFHRVLRDFVLQGGDPTGTGAGGPGYKFDNEDNDLKHLAGSLSMAHAGRNTNGSQFFIVIKPQPHLDGLHTVFGKVIKGNEFIDHVQIPQGTKMTTVEVFEEAL